jgi:hypothetical protein
MPRVSSGAAVLLALLLTTAGIGAAVSMSLFCSATTAEAGGTVPVTVTLPGASGVTVHLFAGTEAGETAVFIQGTKVMLPVSGYFFSAGTLSLASGTATIDAAIPNDPTLVGLKIIWVAVVLDNATGRVLYMAHTGGPIIEDAIC